MLIANNANGLIDSSDTTWVKIISDGVTGFGIKNQGTLKIDSVKITSWNTASNTYASPGTDGNTPRGYIVAQGGATGKMDILDSEIAYLGYHGTGHHGLDYYDSDNSLIQGNHIHHNWRAFYSSEVGGITIDHNNVHDNLEYGIDPHSGTHDMYITFNKSYNNNHGIICSQRCYNLHIENNEVYANNRDGIYLDAGTHHSTIANNIIYQEDTAIQLPSLSYSEVYGNTISESKWGIKLYTQLGSSYETNGGCGTMGCGSTNNNIHDNQITATSTGIEVRDGASSNTIESNTINGASTGRAIVVEDSISISNVFKNNEISSSPTGMKVTSSNKESRFIGNEFTNVASSGEYALEKSSALKLENTVFSSDVIRVLDSTSIPVSISNSGTISVTDGVTGQKSQFNTDATSYTKTLGGNTKITVTTVSSSPPPPTDTTPPTVISTNPSGGATGVGVTSSVTATFSEPVQSPTVTSSSFTLKQGTTSIPGAVSLSTDGKTATFNPSSSLADSTTFTATISTAVKDLAGNAMTSAKTWSFTTASVTPPPPPPPPTDTTSPTVISTNPSDGATGVGVTSSVTATFSEPVQSPTVTSSSFTLKQGTTSIPGAVSLSTDGKTATFNPSSSLADSTTFTATITTAVKDLADNAMTSAKTWSFTTATPPPPPPPTDTTPPTVISTNPSDGATGVGVTSSVTATFSEPVQSSTVTSSSFTLKEGTTSIQGAVSLSTDGKTATFNPSSSLADSTTFTATITTAVKDLAGNAMTSAKTWSFTTASVTPPPPTSCGKLPVSSAIASGSEVGNSPSNVIDNDLTTRWSNLGDNSWVQLDLGTQKTICNIDISWYRGNERVNDFIISGSNDGVNFVNIFSGASTGVTADYENYEFEDTEARFIKITVTGNSQTDWISISEIRVNGNEILGDNPPTVVSTNPSDVATGVGVTSSVTATFSEAVQSSTVTSSSFTLKEGTTSIQGAVSLSTDGKTATFNPSSSLADSTTFTATITTAVKDLAGNAMTSAKTWSFTTATPPPPPPPTDTTPPTVISTNPSDGATGVGVTSSVTATFSEPVQSSTVTSSSFTLKEGTTSIQGDVSLSSDGKTATFNPSSSLADSTTFTATITTAVKDLTGNAMTSAKTWSFTTAGVTPPPPPPPSTSCGNKLAINGATSSPSRPNGFGAEKAIDDKLSTKWWSTFSVNPWIRADLGTSKSICSVDISWTDGDQRTYSFKISASADGNSYTDLLSTTSKGTTSPERYSFGETQPVRYVKVTITESHSGSSNSMAQISELELLSKSSTSTTPPPPPPPTDTTSPTVISTNPSGGATGVGVTSSVTATFSEPVQSSTVTSSSFTLKEGTTSIQGAVSLSTDGKTATFNPSSSLADSTTFTATITTAVKDLAGNAMTSAKTWSFTTASVTPPPPPPPPTSCGDKLAINGATSSPTQNGYGAGNAIDDKLSTKWWSTFSVNPWIRADLGTSKSICSVDISWTDGDQRTYSFKISASADGNSYTDLLSTTSKGTTSPERYSFGETQPVRYVKVTITQSHSGSSNSMAQMAELDIFGESSSASTFMTSNSVSGQPEIGSSVTEGGEKRIIEDQVIDQSPSTSPDPNSGQPESDPVPVQEEDKVNPNETGDQVEAPNNPPIAKNDRSRSESNEQVLINVLANDKDPDGDDLRVSFVSPPADNIGTVTINKDQTITFMPLNGITGKLTLSYEVSDERGESDKAKIFIIIKPPKDTGSSLTEPPHQETKNTRGQGELENGDQMDNENNQFKHFLDTGPSDFTATELLENDRPVAGNTTLIVRSNN